MTDKEKYALHCEHNFCSGCFGEYVKTCLEGGIDLFMKKCPMAGCKERLGLDEFDVFLSTSQEKYLVKKLILKDVLAKNKSVHSSILS